MELRLKKWRLFELGEAKTKVMTKGYHLNKIMSRKYIHYTMLA